VRLTQRRTEGILRTLGRVGRANVLGGGRKIKRVIQAKIDLLKGTIKEGGKRSKKGGRPERIQFQWLKSIQRRGGKGAIMPLIGGG